MRKLLVGTLALAMVAAPAVALAHGGGNDHKGDKHGNKPATPPAAAPAVTFTTIPCVKFQKPHRKLREFKLRGTVMSVSGNGVVVDVDKINGNFAKAVGNNTVGGSYDATIQIPFGDCTRVKADGHGSHERGKNKNRGFGLIAAGDKIKMEWKEPKGTLVNALGAPNRIDVHKVGKKHNH